MKAMILAAGEGTRLRPLTLALPKPMVPLANTPLLTRTIRLLATHGVTEIAVNLHHLPEAIRAALGDGAELGVHLCYSDEPTLMGTAGGVKRMERFLDETFLVLYGDNLYGADFGPLIEFHRERGALATLATFEAANPSACGLVMTDSDGRVTRFQEKLPPAEVFTNQANAGVYVLEPEVLDLVPRDTPWDFGRDVFPGLLSRRTGAIFARPLGGYLQDTGTIESYKQANFDLIEGRVNGLAAESAISASAVVSAAARVGCRAILGPGTVVEDDVTVDSSIVWEGARVGAGASVRDSILGRGVVVGSGAVVDGAILADGVVVAPGTRVPTGARIDPGTRVG